MPTKRYQVTPGLISRLREGVRAGKFKFARSDPNFIRFLAEELGVSEDEVRNNYNAIATEINNAMRAAESSAAAPAGAEQSYIRHFWLASFIYVLLWERRDELQEPPAVTMYRLLEPIMTAALAGDELARAKVRLLFLPISLDGSGSPARVSLSDALGLLRELMEQRRDVFCGVSEDKYKLLCLRGSALPEATGPEALRMAGALSYSPTCLDAVHSLYEEVCAG